MQISGMKKFFEAEGKGSAAAKTETFENASTAKSEDIESVLHFDPFKKGEVIPESKVEDKTKPAAKTAKEDKTEVDDEKTNIPVKESKAPASKKESSEATKPTEDQAAYWRGIAEARQEALNAKAPSKETKEEVENKIPNYAFEIPDELITALTSPEAPTFKKGLQALVQGMAGAIHAQMDAHMQKQYNPRFESLPAMVQQVIQAQAKAKSVHDDFYGKYPELNHPQLKNLVKATGEAIAKKLGKNDWDEELRDAVALEVKGLLSSVAPKNGKDTNPPPRMLPTQGARTIVPADDIGREIADTLFSEF